MNSLVFLGVFRDFGAEIVPLLKLAGLFAETDGDFALLSAVNSSDWVRRDQAGFGLDAIKRVIENRDTYLKYLAQGQSLSAIGAREDIQEINSAIERQLVARKAKDFQGIRSHPRRARQNGRRAQRHQGRHHLGDRAMRMTRTPNPSPLAGEVGARTRSVRAAGEGPGGAVDFGGAGSREPSPGHSLRSRPSSPARGEGKSSVAGEMRRRARALRARITDAERKLWFALRDRRFAGFKFRRKFRSIASLRILFISKRVWSSKWTAVSTPARCRIDGGIAGLRRTDFA